MPSYSRSCGVGLVLYGASHEMDRPRGSHFDLGLLSFNCRISPPLNIAPNPQLLDFEVVESHAVAPVRILFKEDGAFSPEQGGLPLTLENGPRESKSARLCVGRSLAAIPCHTAYEGRGSKSRTAKTQSSARTRSQTRRRSSAKGLHRKSRSAAASQPGARAVSNPYTFGIPKQTTLPAPTPSKEGLAGVCVPELKAERRCSFGATFSFLQPRHRRDHLGSRSSTLNTKSGALTSGLEDGEVVEPRYQDRSRFPLSQRKTDATPNFDDAP